MASEDGEALEGRVLALAEAGMGRVEIAAALGLTQDELEALEAERPAFAQAMRRAGLLEQAWWAGLPREALSAGRRFHLAGWLGEMRARLTPPHCGGAAAGTAAAPPLARIEIPDNGRGGPRMPESYYQGRDEAWWRAEEIREADADLRRAEESFKHSARLFRDEERELAELRAKLTWLHEAPLGAEAPETFLPDEPEETEDDDGWN